jgi:hypothetical protein
VRLNKPYDCESSDGVLAYSSEHRCRVDALNDEAIKQIALSSRPPKRGPRWMLNEHRARNLWRSAGRGRARGYCDISCSVLAERAIAAAANRGDTELAFISPTRAPSARICRFAENRSYRPGHAPGGAVALTSGGTGARSSRCRRSGRSRNVARAC